MRCNELLQNERRPTWMRFEYRMKPLMNKPKERRLLLDINQGQNEAFNFKYNISK